MTMTMTEARARLAAAVDGYGADSLAALRRLARSLKIEQRGITTYKPPHDAWEVWDGNRGGGCEYYARSARSAVEAKAEYLHQLIAAAIDEMGD